MPPQPSAPTGRQARLLLLLPLLLLVAIAVNWTSVNKLLHGKATFRSILTGLADSSAVNLVGWEQPPDSGDPQARVKVEVFLAVGDPCHIDSAYLGQALGLLDPRRIRVQFVDVRTPTGMARKDKLKLGCEQGLALNGQTEFRVPDPQRPGKQKTVFLTHDGGGLAVLHRLLNAALKAAYKGQGLPLSEAEFNSFIQTETKRIATEMEAAAKVRLEEKKRRR